MFWVKKDSQKQMPKIDFSKKGENTYFKTHNRLFFGYFFNRQPIWEALLDIHTSRHCPAAWPHVLLADESSGVRHKKY